MQIEMFSEEFKASETSEEVWVECPGFPVYEVSSLGRFRNLYTGKIMSTKNGGREYMVAQLMLDGRQYRQLAHRIVCTVFNGPSPEGKPFVNHIDGDKTNNAASNLEWVSNSENAKHSWGMRRRREREDAVDRYVTCYNSV